MWWFGSRRGNLWGIVLLLAVPPLLNWANAAMWYTHIGGTHLGEVLVIPLTVLTALATLVALVLAAQLAVASRRGSALLGAGFYLGLGVSIMAGIVVVQAWRGSAGELGGPGEVLLTLLLWPGVFQVGLLGTIYWQT